ncbi:MAG: DUF1365 domain-containing protein, partial [Pseudomonadota bacterium]
MDRSPANIYLGQTRHSRFTPFEQSFAYRLFLLDLDIDRLEEADRLSSIFSVDKPNLFSFRRRDHGDRQDSDLRPWAERLFASADISLDRGPIRLVTLPRHLFYKFAPISLWFGYSPESDLRGVIYEVNNTFGDSHAYVAPADSNRSRHEADKQMYVSPFFDVSGRYRFTLRPPTDRLGLIVENIEGTQRTHMASIKARRCPATTGNFLRAAISQPFSTHGVTAGIHWEALKLWRKGAGSRRRPVRS